MLKEVKLSLFGLYHHNRYLRYWKKYSLWELKIIREDNVSTLFFRLLQERKIKSDRTK